jgi:UDP-glucose 4-epimerase
VQLGRHALTTGRGQHSVAETGVKSRMALGDLAGRSVLVTGASGFVGANLCAALIAAGARITAVSRRSPQREAPGASWCVLDPTKADALTALLHETRPEFIFHLAGYVTGARGIEHVLPALEANCVMAVNLMVAAAALPGVRVVLANSLEEPAPTEADPPPVSPYAAAKLASTSYARMFHSLYGLHATPVRIAMGYGPRQMDFRKLVPYAVRCALTGEAPRFSSGAMVCDWVYAEDIVTGMVATALSERAAGEAVDIASGEMASVADVVRQIFAIVGAPAPEFGVEPDRALERLRYPDVERTFALTDWRAKVELEEGLRRTVDWYRAELAGS